MAAEYNNFIEQARAKRRPLVVMAFSSMPVSRETILTTALKMVDNCAPQPAVVAMIGSRPLEEVPQSLQKRVDVAKQSGMLMEGRAAPFNLLLPQMDCNIIHGGLGTTAEALRAGKPIIVTGTLLMDQRFWGMQVCDATALWDRETEEGSP